MAETPRYESLRKAVALAYQMDEQTPRVVAQGYGSVAEQIIAEANRHGVFVHAAPELVSLLMQLDLDERIPPRLYDVIAELLVWVQEINGKGMAKDSPGG
ncbi:MAG: EscU/YscU/HrcU family type III secretion system export apparatus switch protein [Pseudomonadales bacterium]|nr:EscU/YscU/HrcU family type III secretion system export apparatus switch protein [Pseudomonadales bacterium]